MTCAKTSLPVFIGDARSPVGIARNATSDVQIETSFEHGISSILQLVIRPQRENVGTLLSPHEMFERVSGRFEVLLELSDLPRDPVTNTGESVQALIVFKKNVGSS